MVFGQSGEAILALAASTGGATCTSALMSADSGSAAGVYEERARLTTEAGREAPGFGKASNSSRGAVRPSSGLASSTSSLDAPPVWLVLHFTT